MFQITAEEKEFILIRRELKAESDDSYEPSVSMAAVDLIRTMNEAHKSAEVKWDQMAFAKDLQDAINRHATTKLT